MIELITGMFKWIMQLIKCIIQWFRFSILDSRGTYFLTGILLGAIGLNLYTETNNLKQYLQSNTSARTIIIHDVKAETEPEPIDRIEKLTQEIYKKESSNGLNDQKCERLGLHNGYGYAQGENRNFCTKSDAETKELVLKKIQEFTELNLSDNQILCLYNTGQADDYCPYLEI